MRENPFPPDVVRAAKLSRVPGVTIAEACARFRVPHSAVSKARRALPRETTPSLAELVLAALTTEGRESSGTLGDLTGLAGYVDYVNHDGCTETDVRRLLDRLVEEGAIRIDGDRWEMLRPWP